MARGLAHFPAKTGWESWAVSEGSYQEAQEGKFMSDITKKFFTVRMVGQWNRLPREIPNASILKVFKASE